MRPDSPLDPTQQIIDLRDGPLLFTTTGSGRPVIAIHGMPATGWDFRWLDAALAGRVQFIRLDLPGFGASPVAGHQGHTVEDAASVVCEFCHAAEVNEAIVLGHSMAGPIAVEAAAQSSRIAALALVNSAGPFFHRGIFPVTYRRLLRVVDLHPVSRRLTLTAARPVARALGFSKHLSDEEYIRAIRLCAEYQPQMLGEHLARLTKPVFIAWADDDPAIEPRVSEALVECAPNPERLHFATGGHNLQSTRATELADAIVAWSDSW